MDFTTGDISHLVFRRVLRNDLGSVSLTSQALNLLVSLDGKEPLGTLAAKLGLPMTKVRDLTADLHRRGLVEPVSVAGTLLGPNFLAHLKAQLALAIGPIAGVILEDAIADLGHAPSRFPAHRAAELVDLLSREIHRDEKRTAFQKSMLQKLAERA